MRTAAAPAVLAVMLALISVLAYYRQTGEEQMDQLTRETDIAGYFMTVNGKQIDTVGVTQQVAAALADSGYFSEMEGTYIREFHYKLVEDAENWQPEELSPYGYERRIREADSLPWMVFTTDLSAVREFFYVETPNVRWLEGYGEEFLKMGEEQALLEQEQGFPCLASEEMLAENGLNLGDSFWIEDHLSSLLVKARAVGSYEGGGQFANLYFPFVLGYGSSWENFLNLEEAAEQKELDSLRFHVKDAKNLRNVKDFLAELGLSQKGQYGEIRKTVVLEDMDYQKSMLQLSERLQYLDLLYPALLALSAAISFALSYLLVLGRKQEMAMMRGMGSGAARAFFSLFAEQVFLCLAGGGGFLLLWRVFRPVTGEILAGGLAVMLCYLAGAAVSAAWMNRGKAAVILSEKE